MRKHGMQPVADALFADLFFHLFEAAEFDARGALRFLWRHASADVLVDQQGEVGLDLLVEVSGCAMKTEKIAQEISGFHVKRHDGTPLYDACRACAMAREMRPQRLVSAASCFCPALVRR